MITPKRKWKAVKVAANEYHVELVEGREEVDSLGFSTFPREKAEDLTCAAAEGYRQGFRDCLEQVKSTLFNH